MADEVPQQLELGQREAEVLIIEGCTVFVLVYGQIVYLNGPTLFDAGAAQNGADVREDDLRRYRLRQVIVAAHHQSLDLILLLDLGAQEDNGNQLSLSA